MGERSPVHAHVRSGDGFFSPIVEWLAGVFGATRRGFGVSFAITLIAGSILSVLLTVRWGLFRGLGPVLALLVIAALAAKTVGALRDELWRAASLKLDNPRQRPKITGPAWLMGPTASALGSLALAVNAVRRGELVEANDLTPLIDRHLLRPEEARLLDAVRAMISLGMGEKQRAAQQAFAALPTGSPPLDEALGRVAVADAWHSPTRLRAIDSAWEAEGVGDDLTAPMGRLHRLVKLRIEGGIETLPPEEARALCDEARAIGDDLFAVALEARARSSTYR
jgi:hypothetical protein